MEIKNVVFIDRNLQNGRIQRVIVDAIPSTLSKSFLNKVIKWSSSRYEVWKKDKVVERILTAMKDGSYIQRRFNDKKEIEEIKYTTDYFHSGSYCECSSMSRKGTYYIDYSKKVLIDIDDLDSGEITKVYAAYQF